MQNWVWLMNSAISAHQVTLECRCTNLSLSRSIRAQTMSDLMNSNLFHSHSNIVKNVFNIFNESTFSIRMNISY